MTAQQKKLLIEVIEAIRAAVRDSGPLGCPEGTVYAALMAQGCTLAQFEGIIALMVRTGAIHKQGHLPAKARISRSIGIPLSESGRDQKVGRFVIRLILGLFR